MHYNQKQLARHLMTGAAGAALLALAPQAYAQTGATSSAPSTDDDVEELVVTAQKREERLLDVPVSVTALTSTALAQQNLVRLTDYAARIPGLAIGGSNIQQISLRGINTGGATNPAVAVTIDDIPLTTSSRGTNAFPDVDPADLARIEVLRGPQGTLYGAASLGGLIKLVTNDADTNDFSGRVEFGYNHTENGTSGYVGRAAANIPVLKDKVAIRFSAFRRDDPRYIDNVNPLVNGRDVNKSRTEGTRVAVTLRPIDRLTINLSRLEQTVRGADSGPTEVSGYPTDFKPVRGYFVTNVGPSTTGNEIKLNVARVTFDAGPVQVVTVSGWSKYRNDTDNDVTTTFPYVFNRVASLSASPLIANAPAGSSVRLKNGNVVKKFVQEVRLSSTGDGPIQWLIGGFYTDEETNNLQSLQAFDPAGGLLSDLVQFPVPLKFKEKAAFADVTYRFNEQFDVQVGARYSKNRQAVRQDQVTASVATAVFGPSSKSATARSSDDAFTWLITPRYKLNADMMLYARIATGYRPGGPNIGVPGAPSTYGSDTVTNYEIGAKGYVLDRTVTVDASVFDIEWKDIQIQNTTPTNLGFLSNGGKARSRGVEAAVQWAPGGGWVVNANATYTDARLTEVIAAQGLIGPKGTRLPYTPRFASNLGVDKTFDLVGGFRATLGVNWSHIGERNSVFRSALPSAASRSGAVTLPAYDLVDLRATVTDGKWSLTGYLRNIGSSRGVIAVDDRQGVVAVTNATFVVPQTAGLLLSRVF